MSSESEVAWAAKRVHRKTGETRWYTGCDQWTHGWRHRFLDDLRPVLGLQEFKRWRPTHRIVLVTVTRVVKPKPKLVSDLELWVLKGVRDGRAAYAFFPSPEHTAAWESCSARGWIYIEGHDFKLTTDGKAILRKASR